MKNVHWPFAVYGSLVLLGFDILLDGARDGTGYQRDR